MTGPCSDVAVFAADTIYLVANPDIASVRNAHRVVDRMGQLGAGKDRLRMLLNRMSDQHEIGPKQIESDARASASSWCSRATTARVGGAELGRAADAEQSLGAGRAVRARSPGRSCLRMQTAAGGEPAAGARVVPGTLLRHGHSRHRQSAITPGRRHRPHVRPATDATRGARSTSKCAAPCTASC